MPKCENQKIATCASLKALDTGFRLPGDGEVRDSQHQESRSVEMRNPEITK
jgi:hypothetical protein